MENGDTNVDIDIDAFLSQFYSSLPKDNMCPIHPHCFLEEKYAVNGWKYVHCSHDTNGVRCFVSTGADEVNFYMEKVRSCVLEYYKENLDKLSCYCDNPLILSISKSSKNLDRPYFRCRRNMCRFFQWADIIPTVKVKAWFEGGKRHQSGMPSYMNQVIPSPVSYRNVSSIPFDLQLWNECQAEEFRVVDSTKQIVSPSEVFGYYHSKESEPDLKSQIYIRRLMKKHNVQA